LIRAFETPEYLRDRCSEMREQAPTMGLGYKKGRLEPHVHARLLAHFRDNIERFSSEGPVDEIRTSDHQTIPTLLFADLAFNVKLAEELKPLHEEWAGVPLTLSSCHGIRCYQRGTFLYMHVDRQPHFISSTICVDRLLATPWPLSILNVDGQESQIDLEPGEFVLYEGARLPHGRPYPLDGDFHAEIFVHYHPAVGVTEEAGR
jgi:prolyl 4-hydroxylase